MQDDRNEVLRAIAMMERRKARRTPERVAVLLAVEFIHAKRWGSLLRMVRDLARIASGSQEHEAGNVTSKDATRRRQRARRSARRDEGGR